MSHITILHLGVDMKDQELAGVAICSVKPSRDWLTITVGTGNRPDYTLTGEMISTQFAESLIFRWQNGKYVPVGDTYGTKGEVARILKDVTKAYKHHGGIKVLTKLKYKVKQDTRQGTMVAHGRRY